MMLGVTYEGELDFAAVACCCRSAVFVVAIGRVAGEGDV